MKKLIFCIIIMFITTTLFSELSWLENNYQNYQYFLSHPGVALYEKTIKCVEGYKFFVIITTYHDRVELFSIKMRNFKDEPITCYK